MERKSWDGQVVLIAAALEKNRMHAIYRNFRTALHALRRNVMRSVLTCLGIIIGIAAVIAMMEIGQGSAHAIQQTIESIGANQIGVEPKATSSGGVNSGAATNGTKLWLIKMALSD
jgi:ABC-type lipoprotein release transport system permease subunit